MKDAENACAHKAKMCAEDKTDFSLNDRWSAHTPSELVVRIKSPAAEK